MGEGASTGSSVLGAAAPQGSAAAGSADPDAVAGKPVAPGPALTSTDAPALVAATEHQPGARAMLLAGMARGPSHAYLFQGAPGSGKRTAARAFAAELLAQGALAPTAGDPEAAAADARRRALLDPSPHPDLVWVAPDGAQHRVEELRERVIRAAAYRPYEGGRRVFVIEAAEAMREESQNALLKTLEEPPPFAHLVLLGESTDGMLPTIASRCQVIQFRRLPATAVEGKLREDHAAAGEDTVRAAARLSAGDTSRARYLLGEEGAALRDAVVSCVESALPSGPDSADADPAGAATEAEPWRALLAAAEVAGKIAETAAQERLDTAEEYGAKLSKTESGQAVRRESRKARTEVLDLGLELCEIWFRDLAAFGFGADEVVMNCDRTDLLGPQAARLDPAAARQAAEVIGSFRSRLALNVSEELALEALHSRLRRTLGA